MPLFKKSRSVFITPATHYLGKKKKVKHLDNILYNQNLEINIFGTKGYFVLLSGDWGLLGGIVAFRKAAHSPWLPIRDLWNHCFIFISASSFLICPISLFTPISRCSGSTRMAGSSLSVIYCYFPNNDNTWPEPAGYSMNAPRVNHRTDLNFQHRPQILHSVQTEFLAAPKHTWPHDFCLRELTSPLLLHSLTHPQSLAQSPSFNVLPP